MGYYRIKRIIDGDTLAVKVWPWQKSPALLVPGELKVRVWGINAVEKGERGYAEASRKLASFAPPGRFIRLRRKNVDKYGRIVADCKRFFRLKSVSEKMILSGHAKYVKEYAPDAKHLERAQAKRSKGMIRNLVFWVLFVGVGLGLGFWISK